MATFNGITFVLDPTPTKQRDLLDRLKKLLAEEAEVNKQLAFHEAGYRHHSNGIADCFKKRGGIQDEIIDTTHELHDAIRKGGE